MTTRAWVVVITAIATAVAALLLAVYAVWTVDDRVSDYVEDHEAGLEGPRGPVGPAGEQGPPGDTGAPGPPGAAADTAAIDGRLDCLTENLDQVMSALYRQRQGLGEAGSTFPQSFC